MLQNCYSNLAVYNTKRDVVNLSKRMDKENIGCQLFKIQTISLKKKCNFVDISILLYWWV